MSAKYPVYVAISIRRSWLLLACLAALVSVLSPTSTARAGGIVTDCVNYGPGAGTLADALAGGGTVAFACSGTIIVPEIVIATNTVIDGNGQRVTLSGNNANRVLRVDSGATLDLLNITIADGNDPGGSPYTFVGGGVYTEGGLVNITNCTITGNSAVAGGGIYNNGTVNIVNSTISGNSATAGGGGGIGNEVTRITDITNSTITSNSALVGGGIENNAGTVNVTNSIVANNTGNCHGTAPVNDGGNNIEDGTGCSFGGPIGSNTDPLLGPLVDNGGSTFTHALLSGSPAIDAGDDSACPTTDQRGVPRPQGVTCDIGAYEVVPPYTVTKTADTADGTCDEDCSLREAIIAANASPGHDTINVPAGTYILTRAGSGEDAAATGDLDITDDLTIIGVEAATTIDGGGIDRVFHVIGSTTVEMTDVTIRNGSGGGIYNNGGSTTLVSATVGDNRGSYGGGITNDGGGTMELIDSTVISNSVSTAGGGIYNSNSELRLINSSISNNGSGETGGGIQTEGDGTVELTNSVVSDNEAWGGGGIMNYGETVTLTNSTVSGNTAQYGGGIANYDGTLMLDHSIVNNNTVTTTATDGYGGGIYNADILTLTYSTVSNNNTYGDHCHGGGIHNEGRLALTNSTISDNSASTTGSYGDGGGIHNTGSGSQVMLSNSTVSGNRSNGGGSGGGLWNSDGASMELTNSTVSGNTSSGNGGGINSTHSGVLTLNNTTISDNSAYGRGGGIWNDNNSTVNFKNTIIARNTAFSASPDCDNTATLTSGDYNLVGNTAGCPFTHQTNDQVSVDPLLDPLQLNPPGNTETHALLCDSPAIDAIPEGSCTDHQGTPITTDQRGVTRPQRVFCDIGAYEFQSLLYLPIVGR